MISRQEIEALAQLSRLKLSTEEMASLEKECAAILEYVGHINSVAAEDISLSEQPLPLLRNVMRDDVAGMVLPSSPETLLGEAPRSEQNFIVVRKILEKDAE